MLPISPSRPSLAEILNQAVAKHGDSYTKMLVRPFAFEPTTVRTLQNEITQAILPILELEPEFQNRPNLSLREADGSGITPIRSYETALHLFKVALQQGTTASMAWLDKILQLTEAPSLYIMLLWGISIDRTVTLSANFSLVPFDDLPASNQKNYLNDLRHGRRTSGVMLIDPHLHLRTPSVALVAKTMTQPVLAETLQVDPNDNLDPMAILDDVRLFLVTCAVEVPTASVEWSQYEDTDLNWFDTGFRRRRAESSLFPSIPQSIQVETAQRLLPKYLNIEGKTKDKLHLALGRLNNSMLRRNLADKALDLGIALEVLLSGDDGTNTEIIWRLGFRAAWFIGGDIATRKRTREIITSLYALRSQVAHTGRIKDSLHNPTILENATRICVQVIHKLIERQEMPNWKEFELSVPIENT